MPTALVSGASIAGPALAYWLVRAGCTVTVVERAVVPRPGGQAIDIRGPALTVLDRMGLLDEAGAMRTWLKGMSMLDTNGREIERTEERTIGGGQFDSRDIEILRDDLAGLPLQASGDNAEYIYDDTIATMADDGGGVAVTFQRSPPRNFDLVIRCRWAPLDRSAARFRR